MPEYEWTNEKGEVKMTDKHDTPPKEKGTWTRVFSFGISTVSGAGGSPGRTSVK
jgi:hypothetical protein